MEHVAEATMARLVELRREMFLRARQGEDVLEANRIYRTAAECLVRGDVDAARWILAAGRVPSAPRERGKVIRIEVVRQPAAAKRKARP